MHNKRLKLLHKYPFERLSDLKKGLIGNTDFQHISLSLGEPRNHPPNLIYEYMLDPLLLENGLTTYPKVRGESYLRESISRWLRSRFNIEANPDEQILPVTGTREALFSIAQAVVSGKKDAQIVLPNPFYQIYEGASLLANASPFYVPANPENNYLPDYEKVPEVIWKKCELLYVCSPGNPTGRTISLETFRFLLSKAEEHNFIIAADECYSEIYLNTPPIGLLQAAKAIGNERFDNCLIFHSLSKRSNLPGLRSGFVAGDSYLIENYLKYRTYHGCAMPIQHQKASAAVWDDEKHVMVNRESYGKKFGSVTPILKKVTTVKDPDGGFYHWLATPFDDQKFARELFINCNITVLPGSYLGRETNGNDTEKRKHNPGRNHIRVAWVDETEKCVEAATRMVNWWRSL